MSVGLKTRVVSRQRSFNPTGAYPVYSRVTPLHRSPSATVPISAPMQTVRQLPKPQPWPLWLRAMIGVNRGASLLTLSLTSAVLIIYSQTVYSQQLWNREYRNLEVLQRHERQLISTNEALKEQIAQQAERPATGLVPATPANAIFLQPAAQRSLPAPVDVDSPKLEAPPTAPVGY